MRRRDFLKKAALGAAAATTTVAGLPQAVAASSNQRDYIPWLVFLQYSQLPSGATREEVNVQGLRPYSSPARPAYSVITNQNSGIVLLVKENEKEYRLISTSTIADKLFTPNTQYKSSDLITDNRTLGTILGMLQSPDGIESDPDVQREIRKGHTLLGSLSLDEMAEIYSLFGWNTNSPEKFTTKVFPFGIQKIEGNRAIESYFHQPSEGRLKIEQKDAGGIS